MKATEDFDFTQYLTEEDIKAVGGRPVSEVLVEGLRVVLAVASQSGLSDDEIDTILERLVSERARERFKILA